MKPVTLARLLEQTPIVVTGYGVISAAGNNVDDLWKAALTAQSPAAYQVFDVAGQSRSFAVCRAVFPDPHATGLRAVRRADRCVQLAWLAATQALQSAGLHQTKPIPGLGAMVGSARGPIHKIEQALTQLGTRRIPPSLSTDCTVGSISGTLAQSLKLTGPTATISASCASGAVAIALAAEQILLGKADAALAGGTEAPLTPSILAQLDAAALLGHHIDPTRTCRPFDSTRNGLCLGEGSAFLVLESASAALRRGAKPLARLSGWATCVDHAGRAGVSKSGTGIFTAATQALEVAQLNPAAVDYINAHGTGTRANDAAEANAVRHLFGERASTLPCTSTKPITGHCLGATAALEAVLSIQALRTQMVPPTANCLHQDPACPIHVLAQSPATPTPVRHVLSNSAGFWGIHTSLVLSHPNS